MKSPNVKSKINSKTITKSCKDCNKQVPTACKACSCGYRFRRVVSSEAPATNVSGNPVTEPEVGRSQRIQRTRRERPHFFDSLDYGTRVQRKRSSNTVVDVPESSKSRKWRQTNSQNSTKLPAKSRIAVATAPSTATNTTATTPTTDMTGATVRDSGTGTNAGGSSSSCSSRDEDVLGALSSEKALHYSIILAEINRKYSSVTFHPS